MQKSLLPILFLLFTLFTNAAYPQHDTTSQINLPFMLTDEGHAMLKAKVNGVEGNFIFDTGAGINMLTQNFADKISNLEKTNGFYTGHRATGEELQLDLWIAEDFELDVFNVNDETFAVYDIDFPLDGLISLTVFKDVPITIDYENEILIVESGESMKKRINQAKAIIPIQISEDRGKTLGISTYVHLDNELKLQVGLDSGAGFDVYRFSSRYMELLGIDSSQVDHKYKISAFKPEEGNHYYYAQLPEMSTLNGQVEVRNFEATFIDGLIYEGIMSINWLGDQITIDIPNERLIVK